MYLKKAFLLLLFLPLINNAASITVTDGEQQLNLRPSQYNKFGTLLAFVRFKTYSDTKHQQMEYKEKGLNIPTIDLINKAISELKPKRAKLQRKFNELPKTTSLTNYKFTVPDIISLYEANFLAKKLKSIPNIQDTSEFLQLEMHYATILSRLNNQSNLGTLPVNTTFYITLYTSLRNLDPAYVSPHDSIEAKLEHLSRNEINQFFWSYLKRMLNAKSNFWEKYYNEIITNPDVYQAFQKQKQITLKQFLNTNHLCQTITNLPLLTEINILDCSKMTYADLQAIANHTQSLNRPIQFKLSNKSCAFIINERHKLANNITETVVNIINERDNTTLPLIILATFFMLLKFENITLPKSITALSIATMGIYVLKYISDYFGTKPYEVPMNNEIKKYYQITINNLTIYNNT